MPLTQPQQMDVLSQKVAGPHSRPRGTFLSYVPHTRVILTDIAQGLLRCKHLVCKSYKPLELGLFLLI